jgi:hypothetical protein
VEPNAAKIATTGPVSGKQPSEEALPYTRVWSPHVLVVLCGFALLSSAIFLTWRVEPFDILDFSEFLPLLHQGSGFWDRWHRLAVYYATQGRVAEVVYGFITANYQFFGVDSTGWQVMRAVPMLLIPPFVYFVLRRFGASGLAALIGASLFTVGSISTSAWLRLSGEPLGTLFLLGAATIAQAWPTSSAGRRHTLALAVCLTGLVFSKEALVSCFPFLCVVAVGWLGKGGSRASASSRATLKFLAVCLLIALVLGAALLLAASMKRADAYISLYGSPDFTAGAIITRLAQLSLPTTYYTDLHTLLFFPPNLVFLSCMTYGLVAVVRARRNAQVLLRKLLLALSLPLAGILVYLPWPRYELFYWLPFLLGTALGVALIVDANASSARSRIIIILCWLFVLCGSALHAFGVAELTRAQRRLNYAVAQELARLERSDTVLIASGNLTSQPWQNPAATFSRYVRALNLTAAPPVALDFDCARSASLPLASELRGRLTLLYESGCGQVAGADRILQQTFRYFDWSKLNLASGVQRVAVIERDRRQ